MKKFFFAGILTAAPLVLLLCPPLRAQWEPDVRLTVNDSTSSLSLNNARSVAANGDTVLVVWYDRRDNNSEIFCKRSTNGGTTWGADVRLTSNDSLSEYPAVSAYAGRAHVVWQDGRQGNSEIYYKRSTDNGTTWVSDYRLTSNDSASEYPAVTALGGYVHAVWQDRRNGNYEIYYKRATSYGSSWQSDQRLTSNDSASRYPAVATNETGWNVYVVWQDNRVGASEIYVNCSSDGGTSWETLPARLSYGNIGATSPSVAAYGKDVHVVWRDIRDGVSGEIYYVHSGSWGAAWDGYVRLTNNAAVSQAPTVAASGNNVHVVWLDYRDANYEIYYKRSLNNGVSWGPDVRLTNNNAVSQFPSLAISGDTLHAVWRDNRDGNREIYYKRNLAGSSGVEGTEAIISPRLRERLKVAPNPFASHTAIPGQENGQFVLYDVSGRLVEVCNGSRIGEHLTPGVYFLKDQGSRFAPVRLVKVR